VKQRASVRAATGLRKRISAVRSFMDVADREGRWRFSASADNTRPVTPPFARSITIWRPFLQFGALLDELNQQAAQRPVFDAHECLRQSQSMGTGKK
jgi:hypothetical protein